MSKCVCVCKRLFVQFCAQPPPETQEEIPITLKKEKEASGRAGGRDSMHAVTSEEQQFHVWW